MYVNFDFPLFIVIYLNFSLLLCSDSIVNCSFLLMLLKSCRIFTTSVEFISYTISMSSTYL
jgi:hypothetical protein